MVKICGIMLLVGSVVRVPTPWWTTTQSYWLPISKFLQALNVYNASKVFTTKRVGVSDAAGRAKRMTKMMGNTTMGDTTRAITNTSVVPASMNTLGSTVSGRSPAVDFKSTSRVGTANATSGRPMMMVIQPPGGHRAPL